MPELPVGEWGYMDGIWHPCQGADFVVGFPGETLGVAPGSFLRPFQGLGVGVLGHDAASPICGQSARPHHRVCLRIKNSFPFLGIADLLHRFPAVTIEVSGGNVGRVRNFMQPTNNLRVRQTVRLTTPNALKSALPMTLESNRTVVQGRSEVQAILGRRDQRMLVVIGPCSIHDPKAALEYATRLNLLRQELSDRLVLVMRVYFEKPRTTIGWKGLINDPHMDGTYDIETGLRIARQLLLQINDMGLPAATEFLDPITPQYLADLVTWAAIGARTTESQTHREMASGLSMPVGFKNGTDGSLQIAIDAMKAAMHSHSFLGIDQDGATSIIRTAGNPEGHVVLRGGRLAANYDAASIAVAVEQLRRSSLLDALMVDCSHANSGKIHTRQEEVMQSAVAQRAAGNTSLIGLMVESHIEDGNQPIPSDLKTLRYGVSVTDACVGWETTERMLRQAHDVLGQVMEVR